MQMGEDLGRKHQLCVSVSEFPHVIPKPCFYTVLVFVFKWIWLFSSQGRKRRGRELIIKKNIFDLMCTIEKVEDTADYLYR